MFFKNCSLLSHPNVIFMSCPNSFQQIMRIFLTFMGNKVFVNLKPTSKALKEERERDYFYTVVKECDLQAAL